MKKRKKNESKENELSLVSSESKRHELTDEEIQEIAEKAVEQTIKDLIEYRKNPPENNVIFWRSNKLL